MAQHPQRQSLDRQANQPHKSVVVLLFVENLRPPVPSVENVIANVADISASGSRHAKV
jgi:hypothetical protein